MRKKTQLLLIIYGIVFLNLMCLSKPLFGTKTAVFFEVLLGMLTDEVLDKFRNNNQKQNNLI